MVYFTSMFKKIVSFPKRILKIKKRYLIAGVLLLILAGWFFLGRGGKEEPVQTQRVEKRDLQTTVSASGTLQGKESATLKFRSSGILSYIKVKEGDLVKKNQLIASLDSRDLSIALQEAKNTLRDKQANVDKVLNDVKDHSSDETLTQRQTRTTAEVSKDNAYEAVRDAELAFRNAIIVSPINGVIVQSSLISGQTVSATDIVAQVVDKSEVYFDAEVDESDIGKVSLGQSAKVTFNTTGSKIFEGSVEKVIPVIKTTSAGATVVVVRINLGNPEITFVPGLNGQVEIKTGEAKEVLSITQDALVGKGEVYIQENGEARVRQVTLGFEGDVDVEIRTGLKEGDNIITNPQNAAVSSPQGGNIFNRFFRQLGGRRRGA